MNSPKTSDKSIKKEWKDLSPKEKKETIAVLLTIGLFVLVWVSSGFRSAVGIVLLAWSLYFLLKTFRVTGRENRIKAIAIAFCLFVVSVGVLPQADSPNEKSAKTSEVSRQAKLEAEKQTELKKKEEAKKKAEAEKREEARRLQEEEDRKRKESMAQQLSPAGDLYRVTSITDGDTIKVNLDGKTETIRFIGMDTPETKDPRKPVQCFGKEASSRMQHYAQSKSVRLEADASQGDRDKYGRLLRYVYSEDGRNIAYEMIKEGYAHEYTYNTPYKYQSQFKDAYNHARTNQLGLWSPSTCSGVTNQELPPPPPPAPVPQNEQPAVAAPQPQSAYYRNCSAARAAGAAPVYAGQPGYGTHLDRDGDGIGCE